MDTSLIQVTALMLPVVALILVGYLVARAIGRRR
jgi:hypothetical protein